MSISCFSSFLSNHYTFYGVYDTENLWKIEFDKSIHEYKVKTKWVSRLQSTQVYFLLFQYQIRKLLQHRRGGVRVETTLKYLGPRAYGPKFKFYTTSRSETSLNFQNCSTVHCQSKFPILRGLTGQIKSSFISILAVLLLHDYLIWQND